MTEEFKKMVAYCGLYCGDCFAYQGRIADLARDLRKELRQARFDRTAESLSEIPFFRKFKNYDECYDVLGAMVKFRCSGGCKSGGGNPGCRIRKCCRKIGLEGCWECDRFEDCEKLEFLEKGHGNAHVMNLRKIKKIGVCSFLDETKQWYHKSQKK